MDASEEVDGTLVVAGGDGAELLEPAEEVLDEVALLVELAIVGALHAAARHGGDHGDLAGGEERLDHPLVGVIGLVGQQSVCLERRQEGVGAVQVVGLARGQQEPQRVAQCVGKSVDFGAQSAPAEPDGFVVPGLFLRAPALC